MEQHAMVFNSLFEGVARLLSIHATAEQIIIVKTAKENIYHCINYSTGCRAGSEYDISDEEAFFALLRDRDETEIQYLIVVWNPNVVELNTQEP